MVCSGNICRSPMAEVVAKAHAAKAGLTDVEIDSCGTGPWHVGEGIDERAQAALVAEGFDGSGHRARQIRPEWLTERDLILAADRGHLIELRRLAQRAGVPDDRVELLGNYHPDGHSPEITDPYFGGDEGFATCLETIEACVDGLISHLASRSNLRGADPHR